MPPNAVKTLRDLLYWQYAKLISESTGFHKSLGFQLSSFSISFLTSLI